MQDWDTKKLFEPNYSLKSFKNGMLTERSLKETLVVVN
uniref:Uncharacterized protein n=1 Tax=Rhizophora mucronata TaxID=61149 RepID=A0A2P2QKF4_RHIMU